MDFKVPFAFCQYKYGVTDQAAFPLAERVCQDRNSQRPEFPPGCELFQSKSDAALLISTLGLTFYHETLQLQIPPAAVPGDVIWRSQAIEEYVALLILSQVQI